MANKKLIEVALPLDKINEASAREKSIRHGHPSTLHLWWARRPLAAARAVIWASLVDDPSSHPEKFPTEEDQNKERQRLFKILDDLVVWENTNSQLVIQQAKSEIKNSIGDNLPKFLDPFAGGGAIPLEAQRLGLEAYAHDLNPIAVMINKAMIEIPHNVYGIMPVNPEANIIERASGYNGAQGLAEDVRYYGALYRKIVFEKVKEHYPKVKVPTNQGGGRATVIAWIWARTCKCPNPACGSEIPLCSTFVLSKKRGRIAWIEPHVDGKKVEYLVKTGKALPEDIDLTPKKGRGALFKCPVCGKITEDFYVKSIAQEGKMGQRMLAVIGEGEHGRVYVTTDQEQIEAVNIGAISDGPEGEMSRNPRWFSPPEFGLKKFKDLFTNRQLLSLTTFCSSLEDIKEQISSDAKKFAPELSDERIEEYSIAVITYLSFLIDQMTNHSSTLCGWNNINNQMKNVFSRQALPMVWDYAECNMFSNSSGSYNNLYERMCKAFGALCPETPGHAKQFNAEEDCGLRGMLVSTDPPYYDNIGYADLSDYFYVWLRRSLKTFYPELFSTMLVPKADELTAIPFNFGGDKKKANTHFETGMLNAFKNIYQYASDEFPVTIYYAYKQQEIVSDKKNSKGSISTGWETMLSAIINAGFAITGTWPIHTERETGLKAYINALASSIVLVCRKRPEGAPQTTRRNLIAELRRELRPALKKMQLSNIAPVDLAQAAIGPGMAVFSKYKRVLEADGSEMSVRSAQIIINEEVDAYFNEQVGSLDTSSRFCVDLYTQYAYNDVKFGEAEVLANAKGTSIPMMASRGVLYAKAGIVHLVERKELPEKVDFNESNIWMLTQQLTYAMEKGGIEACAKIVASMFGSNAENAKDLAYRLYTIAEQKKWANEAYAYNALVVAWPDIQSKAADIKAVQPQQMSIFDYVNDSDNK